MIARYRAAHMSRACPHPVYRLAMHAKKVQARLQSCKQGCRGVRKTVKVQARL